MTLQRQVPPPISRTLRLQGAVLFTHASERFFLLFSITGIDSKGKYCYNDL